MKEDKKELYRLWYEYLKRSPRYKEYCESVRDHPKESVKAPAITDIDDIYAILNFRFDLISKETSDLVMKIMKQPLKFQDDKHRMRDIYITFFDVYLTSFDEWWPRHNQFMEDTYKWGKPADYKGVCEDYDPINQDGGNDPTYVRLTLRMVGYTDEELIKQFKDVLKKKRKLPAFQEAELSYRQYLSLPTLNRKHLDDLRRYLIVYDKKQKLSWPAMLKDGTIKQEFKSLIKKDEDDGIRTLKGMLQKANKIIRNVENDEFPGNYQGGEKLDNE